MKNLKPKKCYARLLMLLSALVSADAAQAQAPRVRKNVKDLTAAEQQTFVDAMLALQTPFNPAPANANLPRSRYEQLVRAHDTNFDLAHKNAFFLPWHRQFLFQMENDVRAMGGKFADFTIPYWDGTRDAYPKDKKAANPADPPVANGLLGNDGVMADGYVVRNGPFANPTNAAAGWLAYSLTGTGTAAKPFVGTRTPLKRRFQPMTAGKFDFLTANGPATLTTALAMDGVTVEDLTTTPPTPGQTFLNFRRRIEAGGGLHNDHHIEPGGVVDRTDFDVIGQLANPEAGTSDPTFWMLHAFTDLNWASWECLRGPLYVGEAGKGLNDAMSGEGSTGTYGLTELNGGTAVTPKNVLNFLTMPGGGYTYDYRVDRTGDARVVLGQGSHVCNVPEPSTLLLGGFGALCLVFRARRQ